MPRHVFDIPEDRVEEVAQKLAHKLAVLAGLQLYHTSDPEDIDLQKIICAANTKIQNMIDNF